ncbi:MAG: nucleoside deaminase [Acidobacteriota bacterium]|nr:nucleoside deaminase [Acidobacteriota bacterium]
MAEAIRIAVESATGGKGGPFGAVVVRDNAIVASGPNLVASANDPTAHAEVVAIRRACEKLATFQLTECELYSSCEPCPMCLGAAYWARVRKIWFAATREDAAKAGFDDSFIYGEFALPLQERRIPMANLMRQEGAESFRAWMGFQARTPY